MKSARAVTVALYLSQRDRALSARRVLELAGDALPIDAVVRLLRDQGIPVRAVAPSAALLQRLPLPALLELKRGELLILEAVAGGRALVRGADDRRLGTPLRELAAELVCACEPLLGEDGEQRIAPRVRRHLSEQTGELARLGVTALALALLGPLSSWLSREALAGAVAERSQALLVSLTAALALVALARSWLSWLRTRTCIATEARVVCASNPTVVRRLLALPYAAQQRHGVAAQWTALCSAELAARSASALAVAPLIEGVSSAAYLAFLLVNAGALGAMIAAGSLLSLAVSYVLGRWRASADVEAMHAAGSARERLQDLVHGIATVKAEHAEAPLLLRWLDALLRERGVCLTRDLRESWLALWLMGSEQVLRLVAVVYGASAMIEGELQLADFIYDLLLTEGVLASLTAACRSLALGLSVRAHHQRVDAVLDDAVVEHRHRGASGAARPDQPLVHMSDVWFRHGPGDPWILEGYDLTLGAGEHLSLRGVSGTGKTTILRLIAGLYRPERGTVSVCGRDPARDRRDVRYLPQQAQLFAGSIRENLEQLSGARLPRVMLAAERTGLVGWLATLPMGIETVVAAQGANLSGGQRQWLLLTAAVASEQPLVLLDEALSQVDHLLRETLQTPVLFAGRTTVSVSHD